MEKTDVNKLKGSGVYLSNFVATALSVCVLILAFAAGFFAQAYFSRGSTGTGTANPTTTGSDEPTITMAQVKDTFNKALIKFGPNNRKLLFVEASDPSCPYCGIASGQNSELNNSVGDRFKLVKDGGSYKAPVVEIRKLVDANKASYALIYRNGHGNGEMGMKALYCAFDQGKFWQAHDIIMSKAGYDLLNGTVKNDKTKSGDIVALLGTGVNSEQLKTCLDSGKYDARIGEDTQLGDTLGLQGTPAFLVNDKLFGGAYNFTDMQPTVDSFLK